MTLYKLEPSEYSHALTALQGVEHALAVNAVIEHKAPGWIAVDQHETPQIVLASAPGAHYLIGDYQNPAFNQALVQLIVGEILPHAKEDGWAVFNLHYFPNGWETVLDDIFADMVVAKNYQRLFRFRQRQIDWQTLIPPGFTMRKIEPSLLSETHIKNIESLRERCEDYRDSWEIFFEDGSFGYCLIHDENIAGWCVSDYVIENHCELSLHTDEKYRRKGVATLTAAAAVDYCLANGLTDIVWNCWSHNIASAAAARKVGFEEILQHHAIHLWLNPVDGFLVNGNLALMRGDHREAAEFYEKAFALLAEPGTQDKQYSLLDWKDTETTYRYHAACAWALAGDRNAALRNLEKAWEKNSIRQGGY